MIKPLKLLLLPALALFLGALSFPLVSYAQSAPTVSYSQTNIVGTNFNLYNGVAATSSQFTLVPNTKLTSIQLSLGVNTYTNVERLEVWLWCGTNTGGSPSSFAVRWVFSDYSEIFPNASYVNVVPVSTENRSGNTNDDPRNTANNQGFWWTPTVQVNCYFVFNAYDAQTGTTPTTNLQSAGINNGTIFTNRPYIVLYSGVATGQSLPVFTNMSYSPGFSPTTTAQTCESNFATSSSFFDSIGSSISNGFCRASLFLFAPSEQSLNQFLVLASSSQEKIPFSYVFGVYDQVNGLSATTTENVPTYTANLAAVGIGSTTPIGNILPNATWLSKATIDTYLPVGIHDALFFLARCGIWFVVIMMFYHRIVPHKAKI